MADDAMNRIWFRGMFHFGSEAEVLGATNNFVGEAIQKLPFCQRPVDWLEPKPCFSLQIFTQIIKLRHIFMQTQLTFKLLHFHFIQFAHRRLVQEP